MRTRTSPIQLVACTFALAAGLGLSRDAFASGFATARFGGEHGNPVTFNPTAIYYNPAGMAESEGIHIFADLNLAFRTATYDHKAAPSDVPEPTGATGANTGKATLFNVAAAPMIGLSAKLGKDFAVGAGFYVPIGGQSTWDQDEDFRNNPKYPGPVDGEQRWYNITGIIRTLYWTVGGAYKIPKTGLSLGLGLNLMRSEIHTVRARNADGSNDIDSEGRSLLDANGFGFGFGAGLMYEALPKRLWLGFSYQSRPGIAGGQALDGTLTNNLAGNLEKPQSVEVNQDMPDVYRLGVKFKPTKKSEVRLFADLWRWSAFETQCIGVKDKPCEVDAKTGAAKDAKLVVQNLPRNWNDAPTIRVGGSYWLVPQVEAFAGLGYDGNAIPDEALDPALTDFQDFSVALGARFQIVKQFAAALSWTQLFYVTRDTNGKSKNDDFVSPSKGPDAGGEYTQRIGVLNVNVEASF